MAKKKTASRKKSTSKKKRSSSAKKKAASRKSRAKATRKKSTRVSTAKKAARKKAARKTSTRKKATAKKAARKTSASKKKAARKKAAAKKTTKKSSKKTTKKSASKAKSSKKKTSGGGRQDSSNGQPRSNLADAKAAAKRLAAAAGLQPVQRTSALIDEKVDEFKRLTKSPLTKRELNKYRDLLLLKRQDVVGDVSDMESGALTNSGSGSLSSLPQHMADQGSDEYDQSLSLGLAASQRKLLKEIDDALERIEQGVYGICELLGRPIHKDRLEATPWTRYCVDGARQLDHQTYSG